MEIIIIEDDRSIRENLQEILEIYQYTVRAYTDGLQGLKGIQEHLPDLVICDIMTPNMDGFELLRTLKSKGETANIPFIFLTAKIERADQRKGMEMGADDYIVKPFTSEEILNAIDIRLQRLKYTETKIQNELDNKLDVFTKINSHEYNTPLNGIIGLSETLQNSLENLSQAEIKEIAMAIKSSAKRLHRTYKNFILYFQLQRGRKNKQKTSINANWLKQYVQNTLTEKAIKFNRLNDIKFSFNIQQDFETKLAADDLTYIIEELIWNALKFSAIKTEVNAHFSCDEHGFLIVISNHTNDEDDFFEKSEPFKQFHREVKEQQGSGLGLYLSKKMAEIQGWHLSQKQEAKQVSISLKIKRQTT